VAGELLECGGHPPVLAGLDGPFAGDRQPRLAGRNALADQLPGFLRVTHESPHGMLAAEQLADESAAHPAGRSGNGSGYDCGLPG
jgi:hypothetical protein